MARRDRREQAQHAAEDRELAALDRHDGAALDLHRHRQPRQAIRRAQRRDREARLVVEGHREAVLADRVVQAIRVDTARDPLERAGSPIQRDAVLHPARAHQRRLERAFDRAAQHDLDRIAVGPVAPRLRAQELVGSMKQQVQRVGISRDDVWTEREHRGQRGARQRHPWRRLRRGEPERNAGARESLLAQERLARRRFGGQLAQRILVAVHEHRPGEVAVVANPDIGMDAPLVGLDRSELDRVEHAPW